MSVIVPNQHPTKPAARRLAICGESPGSDESNWHLCSKCGHGYTPHKSYSGARCPNCGGVAVHAPQPFVGPSGWILNQLLAKVGIDRESCFVGNCCQVQPPGNKIELFKWDSEPMVAGIKQLTADLTAFQPHMILCLGNTPLRAMRNEKRVNIGDWRGSLFMSELAGLPPTKCLATYHPAFLMPSRAPEQAGVVGWDMQRLASELAVDGLQLPKRDIVIAHPDEGWTAAMVVNWCKAHQELQGPLAIDIEGVIDYIECIGFATCKEHVLVVPFISTSGASVWDEDDEVAIWHAIRDLLQDVLVPKALTNALYDAFVLAWTYGIIVQPISDDTMLKWHELYCELEKSLAMQTSVLTRQPFYKFQRKAAAKLAAEAADAANVATSHEQPINSPELPSPPVQEETASCSSQP